MAEISGDRDLVDSKMWLYWLQALIDNATPHEEAAEDAEGEEKMIETCKACGETESDMHRGYCQWRHQFLCFSFFEMHSFMLN